MYGIAWGLTSSTALAMCAPLVQAAEDELGQVFVIGGGAHQLYAWPLVKGPGQHSDKLQLDQGGGAALILMPVVTWAENLRVCPVLQWSLEPSFSESMQGSTVTMEVDSGVPLLEYARKHLPRLSLGQISRLIAHCGFYTSQLMSVPDMVGLWLSTEHASEFTELEIEEIVEELKKKEREKKEEKEEEREESSEEREDREKKEAQEAEEAWPKSWCVQECGMQCAGVCWSLLECAGACWCVCVVRGVWGPAVASKHRTRYSLVLRPPRRPRSSRRRHCQGFPVGVVGWG